MTKYEVWESDFHGGRLISTHRSARAAKRAWAKNHYDSCACGCAYLLLVESGPLGPDVTTRLDARDMGDLRPERTAQKRVCACCHGWLPDEGSDAWEASDGQCPGSVGDRNICGAFDARLSAAAEAEGA